MQKASELDCRSKIEFRERKEGTDPCAERSPSGLWTERFPNPGSRTRTQPQKTRENQNSPKLAVSE